eukprot:CAMPEP_0171164396 /NCGR_PEP_ID=MMETSP0790-20130122/5647_1 /TAXON_ID=2925 /ORGANISM="Alexandrium catenella, Strain OF101" /LENGTH=123 /DNA_ID=CAMNT_0011629151 /DNA_START=46 /DNA_END=413 /DNA_ORIENTATION=+
MRRAATGCRPAAYPQKRTVEGTSPSPHDAPRSWIRPRPLSGPPTGPPSTRRPALQQGRALPAAVLPQAGGTVAAAAAPSWRTSPAAPARATAAAVWLPGAAPQKDAAATATWRARSCADMRSL